MLSEPLQLLLLAAVSYRVVVIIMLGGAVVVEKGINEINIRLERTGFVTEDRRDKGEGREIERGDGEGVVSIGEGVQK